MNDQLNDQPFVTIFQKFFSSRLSVTEWDTVLSEWGKGKIDWTAPVGHTGYHLLGLWCQKNIHPEAVAYFHQNHGSEIFLKPDSQGRTGLSILFDQCIDNRQEESFLELIKTMDIEEFISLVRQKTDKDSDRTSLMGYTTEFWEGDMRAIAFLCSKSLYSLVGHILQEKPQLMTHEQNGWNVASLMGTAASGWDQLMKHGGSIFTPIHISPYNNDETKEGMPLWLWLLKKKNNHHRLQSTLKSLLSRAEHDRAPEEGELVITNEDWDKLIKNISLITSEMTMIEFEERINSDWKAAIKNNKQWREWRSTDGANFMQWLALKSPSQFAQYAIKIKKNQKLLSETDTNGNDIFSYLCLGSLVGEWGSWRRQSTVEKEHWPEMLKIITPHFNSDPTSGILAQWTITEKGFFGRLNSLTNADRGLKQVVVNLFKEHPKLIWNGFSSGHVQRLFESQRMERMNKIISANMDLLTDSQHMKEFQALPVDARVGLLVAAHTTSNLYHTSIGNLLEQKFQETMLETNTLPAATLEKMTIFIRKQKESGYRRYDVHEQIESWLNQQSILRQLHGDIETAEILEAAPIQKKRRM